MEEEVDYLAGEKPLVREFLCSIQRMHVPNYSYKDKKVDSSFFNFISNGIFLFNVQYFVEDCRFY